VAAACLAHDIGNPPFGHSGEDAIRLWFETSPTRPGDTETAEPGPNARIFLRFEGNAQGFRLIARLQSPDNSRRYELTCALWGLSPNIPAPPGWKAWNRLESPSRNSVLPERRGFIRGDGR